MAYSLAFHIVFAAVGIAMPLMMVLAEVMWLRTKDDGWLTLAKRWMKGTAVFFAVGAVSGTVLSFELGLLFPSFMEKAGAVIGMPFSLEGFAFFTEAIFLGLYFYGWKQLKPWVHVACGVVVAASGALSALFVTLVNAWMNTPCCMEPIDPLGAMVTPFAFHEVVHGTLAAYMATAFAVAAIHAWQLLEKPGDPFHLKALTIALVVAVPTALVQPLAGHHAGQVVAVHQPMKLAALEGHVKTGPRAPIHLGPVDIPGGLSFLAFNDFDAVVKGLEEIPQADWPHPIVRLSWLAMVALGTLAAAWAALTALLVWRNNRQLPRDRRWLWATVLLGPAGYIALEAGWVVTEVGRQPWVIYGVLRTHDAVTPVTGLWAPFAGFAVIYAGLAGVVAKVLYDQVKAT
ncbi:MAG: cytochrome ubiquinol oxidase subunit I [Myxococcaceae bacterium]|nr:cytochrome ubiquinol oxidase subunit I [Myxococcaceae bacterium]